MGKAGAVTEGADVANGADVARLNDLIVRQRRELDEVRSQTAVRSIVDLATGMLMEQLGCSPAEAREQLTHLAEKAGSSVAELAAQITRQPPPGEAPDPGLRRFSLAWAAIEAAPDGSAVASALLEEALAPAGAVAVALWLTEPDGGLELIGQAGFGTREAGRWRRIHPDMQTCRRKSLTTARRSGGRAGPAGATMAGRCMGRWPGGARAGLPLRDAGATVGAMVICWPKPLGEFPGPAAPAARGAGRPLPPRPSAPSFPAVTWPPGTAPPGSSASGRPAGRRSCSRIRPGTTPGRGDRLPRSSTSATGSATRRAGAPPSLTGRQLLEMYPAAALAGGLFDRCLEALATGEPQPGGHRRPGPTLTAAVRRSASPGSTTAWRSPGARPTTRTASAALLQHAQRLGRIGGWEENLLTGEVLWTEPTFALFGQPPGVPVPVGQAARPRARRGPAGRAELPRHAAARTSGRPPPPSAIIRADDGSVRQMRAFAEPVTDPAGTVIAVAGRLPGRVRRLPHPARVRRRPGAAGRHRGTGRGRAPAGPAAAAGHHPAVVRAGGGRRPGHRRPVPAVRARATWSAATGTTRCCCPATKCSLVVGRHRGPRPRRGNRHGHGAQRPARAGRHRGRARPSCSAG